MYNSTNRKYSCEQPKLYYTKSVSCIQLFIAVCKYILCSITYQQITMATKDMAGVQERRTFTLGVLF